MSTKESDAFEGSSSRVTVNVDVTRIVKYACIAGVLIVGIILGTRCCHNSICSPK
jgi:hypothetical protein